MKTPHTPENVTYRFIINVSRIPHPSYVRVVTDRFFTLNFMHFKNMHTHTRFPYVLSRFSHVRLFTTPWTTAHLAPLSMGFSR